MTWLAKIKALFAFFLFICAFRLLACRAPPSPDIDDSVPPNPAESITIQLAPHSAAEVVLPHGPLRPLDILLRCQDEKHRNTYDGQNLFQSSLGPPSRKIHSLVPRRSGFVSTVMQAYNGHHNLVIRPDDVWLTILTRFNQYVNRNSEELRSKFVSHDGKKAVTLWKRDPDKSNRYSYDWGMLGQELTEKMDEYLADKSLRPWILPNFTTTTETDRSVASALMLSTFKGYLTYRVMLGCGIPSVTLMGVRADWENLLRRVRNLHRFDAAPDALRNQAIGSYGRIRQADQSNLMLQWQHRLEAVLKRFIDTFDGVKHEEFWSHVFSVKRYGSGRQKNLEGWISAFATYEPSFYCSDPHPFKLDGVRFGCLDVTELPVDVVDVPIQIDDHGHELMGTLVAGVLGARKLDSTTIGFERALWMFENKTGGWVF
ncbi:hypothetical protein GP486_006682 [Trichoglossum hirsutum]|uniref:Uncharacterized protein n=1 Tax=Trichoglossum hirsutum TaxID=265104 RepID=A0A9P8ID94_9PEZI|nr:hypothetical protein GP486_006682 [Trichoglossum hirsutum]